MILGAGASKDFGFPNGRELVWEISHRFDDPTRGPLQNLDRICGKEKTEQAMKFAASLKKADPPSVDVWLEHNPNYIEVGKIAIAMTLLAYEHSSDLRPNNNWYQILFDRLDGPYDEFENNKLRIVTFNYDRSLEQYMFERFRHTHTGKSEDECKEKLNQLGILHVYGSLGRLLWQVDDLENPVPVVPYGANNKQDEIISAANSIEIMSSESSGILSRLLEFQDFMKDCRGLYFLGFGYHEMNMQRLGINTLGIPKKVMGTAYGLSYQRIKEIESFVIRNLCIRDGLFRKSIYEFLHEYVHFNEPSYPDRRVYQD